MQGPSDAIPMTKAEQKKFEESQRKATKTDWFLFVMRGHWKPKDGKIWEAKRI